MLKKKYLVTGGSGFIGSALVTHLVRTGHHVRVLDNNLRGVPERLKDVSKDIEVVQGDVTDFSSVKEACKNVDSVFHLAFLNGTKFFYTKPELVLEIGVKGIVNVLDACKKLDIGELILASSSEVYQLPPQIPTDETAPLTIPDPLNPRYSYAGGKIISELMAINYGRKFFKRVLIFRPHNVYGPDMGWEHVIPEFVIRMSKLPSTKSTVDFPIQGSGEETRSFIYIDDFIKGLECVRQKGEHLGIYHIGTMEEKTIKDVALEVAKSLRKKIRIVPGKKAAGSTQRRCPDIRKVRALGFNPEVSFAEGLQTTAQWYVEHRGQNPWALKKGTLYAGEATSRTGS